MSRAGEAFVTAKSRTHEFGIKEIDKSAMASWKTKGGGGISPAATAAMFMRHPGTLRGHMAAMVQSLLGMVDVLVVLFSSCCCSMLRPITNLQATVAGCMALLSGMVAIAGYGALFLLILSRHLTSVSPVQTVPLYFDYSHPVASAVVDLTAQMTPFPRPLLVGLQQYVYRSSSSSSSSTSRVPPDSSSGQFKPGKQSSQQQQQQYYSTQQPYNQHIQYEQYKQQAGTKEQPGAQPHWQHPQCFVENEYERHLPWKPASTVSTSHGRILLPGQQVRVTVQLQLPQPYDDLFQLSGELLTADGEVVIRAARTHMPKAQPGMMRQARYLFLLPCYAVGLCADSMTVDLLLFDGYVEQPDTHIQGFRALLNSRRSVTDPLRAVLYWLRPSLPLAILLGSAATLLALSASACTMLLIGAALALRELGRQLAEVPTGASVQGPPAAAAAAGAAPPVGVLGWMFSNGEGTADSPEADEDGESWGGWGGVSGTGQEDEQGSTMQPQQQQQAEDSPGELWM